MHRKAYRYGASAPEIGFSVEYCAFQLSFDAVAGDGW